MDKSCFQLGNFIASGLQSRRFHEVIGLANEVLEQLF